MADGGMTVIEALTPAMVLLGVGGASAIASKALKLSPIVGYLAAGVLIGPYAFGVVEENATTHLLAELGVVFLLFDIGMHISAREMRESGRDMIGLAPAHMVLSAVPFTIILGLLGLSWPAAIAIGISLALSSTAVVSRVISDKGINSCPVGKSAIHVLIFQDIVAIFLLIFAASLGSEGGNLMMTMAVAAGYAFIAFTAAILAGRYLMSPFLRLLASTRNQEAFTAATLFLVLGAAAGTYALGLSLTLGAFLAGLAVSGTAFRHQIQTETGPFRGLLLSFFFMSVGLMLDVPAMLANWPLVIATAVGILLLKTALGATASLLNGHTLPRSSQIGFLLAQGSEFTLVVLSILVATTNIVPPVFETVLVASVALSLAIAPVWADLGMKIARKLVQRKDTATAAPETNPDEGGKIVVFGMTDEGRLAADALRDTGIEFVAIDNDPDRFVAAAADGYEVMFGNPANLNLFTAIAGNNATAVVVGAPNYQIAKDLTPTVQRDFPNTARFASLPQVAERDRFRELGFRAWTSTTTPAGIEMAVDLLRHLSVAEAEISNWLKTVAERYDIADRSADIVELVVVKQQEAA
ncbi:cation:proton antiporter [Hyphomonas sp. FCG-A18]|uniref:cation:proton antiporter domain-containing protein n=1 Tax=Hyphomonas sp. FCG-A18 TaxID=3080019 RepID=UPI002B2ABBE4|nr:cation:proton antiporter [Hyphomonas sp. FCG-A18]